MRLPTFSRQTGADTAEEERSTVATGGTTPVRPRRDGSVAAPSEATTTHFTTAGAAADRTATKAAPRSDAKAERAEAKADRAEAKAEHAEARADDKTDKTATAVTDHRDPVVAGPKPRASLLATISLVLAVVAAMLVLSGPLLGYGIGVAGLALILSLSGIHATGKRHVAGKSDALLGMVLSLGAIVVGVLALTGSLSWLGTDMQPVDNVREWLDAQFANRF